MEKKYLVALPLDEIPVGSEYSIFEPFPPQCTLMYWIRLSQNFDLLELEDQLSKLASRMRKAPLVLESSNSDFFGPNGDVAVHVLQRNNALNLFHTELFLQLAKMNSVPDELRWVGAGYRAHVTNVPGRIFWPGTRHVAQSMVLVEKDEQRIRKVVSVYDIRATNS